MLVIYVPDGAVRTVFCFSQDSYTVFLSVLESAFEFHTTFELEYAKAMWLGVLELTFVCESIRFGKHAWTIDLIHIFGVAYRKFENYRVVTNTYL